MPPELVYEKNGRLITFALDKDEVTIGRDSSNDLEIREPSISRRHALLTRKGNAWRLKDLGSRYGTRVNDRPDPGGDLRDGDTIHISRFRLTFREGPSISQTMALRSDTGSDLPMGTVFKEAVDFEALAAAPPSLVRMQKLLTIVTKASQEVLSSPQLDEIFERVLELILEHLSAERACIMLREGEDGQPQVRSVRVQGGESGEGTRIVFSSTIARRVLEDKVGVITSDALTDERFASGASIMAENIRSAMAAPLWSGDRVEGLIYADSTVRERAFDEFDLDLLSALGNHLAVALERSRLQESILEQELVRRRLERYHSPAVVDIITAQTDSGDDMTAEEHEVSVLFADLVGFTPRCEQMEPREVVRFLNRYFSEMVEVVFHHEGTLDKFIGDCIMAVFGAPLNRPDHARRAVAAALEMRETLHALNEPLPREARVRFRVGIHSGRVVAGDIGSISRSDYTVLGATVNLAARLEAQVASPGQIVISDATLAALGDACEVRSVGEHRPKGIARVVSCFEVLGFSPDPPTTPSAPRT